MPARRCGSFSATHLQLLAGQRCGLVLRFHFATALGREGHGAGPAESQFADLGLRADGPELHVLLSERQTSGEDRL